MPKLNEIMIGINTKAIDEAIEKANRLLALLHEAQEIINSLYQDVDVDVT